MKEHFKEQLKNSKPLTKEILDKLKGRSIYSEYRVGDNILWFMEQEIENELKDLPEVNMKMWSVTERELDLLEKDYQLIRQHESIPIMEKKKDD